MSWWQWWGASDTDEVEFNAKDSVSGLDVKIGGVYGHDGDFIQAQVVVGSPLEFVEKGIGMTQGDSSGTIVSVRRSSLIIRILTSANVSVGIRVCLIDTNGIGSWSPEQTLSQSGEQDGSDYIVETLAYETSGAKSVKIKISTLSSGTADVWLATV